MTMIDPGTGNARVPFDASTGNRTADDIKQRLQECRAEFTALDPKRRQGDPEADRALNALVQEVRGLDSELTAVLALERIEAARSGGSSRPLVGTGQVRGDEQQQVRGAQALIDSDVYQDWVNGGFGSDGFSWVGKGMRITDFERAFWQQAQRDPVFEAGSGGLLGSGATGNLNYDATGAGLLLPVGQPIPPIPRQAKLYLRDLIPTMTTSLASVPYVQELNPTSNEAASAVAEGGTKPSAAIAFTGARADPTVIAATLTLSKQLFEDAPLVVQYVNGRLPYVVKFKEDQEFLNGNGTWPNIGGILTDPNILTQAATVGDHAISIGNGFADVEMHDGSVTAVVFNPVDAWFMFIKRAAGGSGTFDAGTPFSALPLTVWGVPTYRTRAKPAGSALVADFQRGFTIIDREQVNVQTYRERYAELNEVLLICEERVGLMKQRPDLACNVTLQAA